MPAVDVAATGDSAVELCSSVDHFVKSRWLAVRQFVLAIPEG